MVFTLTTAQKTELQTLRDTFPATSDGSYSQSLNYYEMYELLMTYIGDYETSNTLTNDEQVTKIWLEGVIDVNKEVGDQSEFIRTYNGKQAELRFGNPLTDLQLDKASDDIALKVIDRVLLNNLLPTVEQAAGDDVATVSTSLLHSDSSAWAGNPLLLFLNYSTPYTTNIIGDGSDAYDFLSVVQMSYEVLDDMGALSFIPATFFSVGAGAYLFGTETFDLLWGAYSAASYSNAQATISAAITDSLDLIYDHYGIDAIDLAEYVLTDDLVLGSTGNDTKVSFSSDDQLFHMGEGNDFVVAGDGDDIVDGGSGADELKGGLGNDSLIGGTGNDTLAGGSGNDTLNGGDGNDWASYNGAANGVTVDLLSGTASNDGFGDTDTLYSIENVIGSKFNDSITGDSGENILDGGAGNDTLSGGGEKDSYYFSGDFGEDTINDTGVGDHLILRGQQIKGTAIRETGSSGPYELTIAEETLSIDHDDSNAKLIITGHDGIITLTNWMEGDYGIKLDEDDEDPNSGDGGHAESGGGGSANGINLTFEFPPASPLVLDMDGDGIELISLANSSAYFDLDEDGFAQYTGWVKGDDALLAYDANGNGVIDDGSELFGSATEDGFTQLAAFDTNGNGFITAADAQWGDLLVWQDANEDGITNVGELMSLSAAGISSISINNSELPLSYKLEGHEITHSNNFQINGATHEVVDVWFENNPIYSHYVFGSNFAYSADVFDLPNLKGYGTAPDLWISMTEDNSLLAAVQNLAAQDYSGFSFSDFHDDVEAIVFQWLGVDGVDPASRGSNVDARIVEGLEVLLARDFSYPFGNPPEDPTVNAGSLLTEQWGVWMDQMATRMLAQLAENDTTIAADVPWINGLEYRLSSDGFRGNFASLIDDIAANEPSSGSAEKDAYWDDLLPLINAAADTLEVSNSDYVSAIQGTHLDTGDILSLRNGEILSGTDAADTIEGSYGDDYIIGFEGDDVLNGSFGSDVFYYRVGDGNDTIYKSAPGYNKLLLGAGIDSSDLTYTRPNPDDLVITFDQGGSVVIKNHFSYSPVNVVEFDNGSLVTSAMIQQIVSSQSATEGDDYLTGTNANEVIDGLGGNDSIYGEYGNDTLYGGDGNDYLLGGLGNDKLYGGNGNDTLEGDSGNEMFYGGAGDDAIYASGGETIDGGTGNDTLNLKLSYYDSIDIDLNTQTYEAIYFLDGSTQIFDIDGIENIVISGAPDCTIVGTSGSEYLALNIGNDSVDAGDGDDTIHALGENVQNYSGIDTINGGGGNDFISGNELSIYDGGTGNDTLKIYAHANLSLNFNGPTNNFSNFENLILENQYNSTITGSNSDNYLQGIGVAFSISGGNGADTLVGGAGEDSLTGGAGNDVFVIAQLGDSDPTDTDRITDFAQGQDKIDVSNLGFDTLTSAPTTHSDELYVSYDSGLNQTVITNTQQGFSLILAGGNYALTDSDFIFTTSDITGTDDDDSIVGTAAADNILALGGDDTILGGAGTDTIDGGDGFDIADYSDTTEGWLMNLDTESADIIGSADPIETLLNIEGLIGGSGNDKVYGDSANNSLEGGLGDDSLAGADGNDTLDGGAGQDKLTGGNGADIFRFSDASHSIDDDGANNNLYDRITDFEVGVDKIDLRPLDIYELRTDSGNTDFGQVRLSYSSAENRTYIKDDVSHLSIRLDGDYTKSVANGGMGILTQNDLLVDTIPTVPLVGTTAADVLDGTLMHEYIEGLDGADTIDGGAGNDTLDGGAGQDRLVGGAGADVFRFSDITHSIDDNGAYDNLYDRIMDFDVSVDKIDLSGLGFVGFDTDGGNTEAGELRITISGSGLTYIKSDQNYFNIQLNGDYSATFTSNNIIWDTPGINGTVNADTLSGSAGDDILNGLAGDDTIDGNAGNDTIDGGLGQDNLTGGAGDDVFKFSNAADSIYISSSTMDKVTDFVIGDDQLDVSALGVTGIVYGSGSANGNTALVEIFYSASSNRTYIRQNDGDGNTDDFAFYLAGNYADSNEASYQGILTTADFILV